MKVHHGQSLHRCHSCHPPVLLLATWLLLPFGAAAAEALPTRADERSRLVGTPADVSVEPAQIVLGGPRGMQQILVTGKYPGGAVRDLTAVSAMRVEDPTVATLEEAGCIRPLRDGTTAVVITVGNLTRRVPCTISGMSRTSTVSFRHDLIATLNVGGCNAGACHGTPSGKNGFRLSLRGFDPAADYIQLTRDVFGRRADRQQPEAGLIYQKAVGLVPHEGGARFARNSLAGEVMLAWLAEGLQDDPSTLPALTTIEVLPGPRVLLSPARWQQLAVRAHFADGSTRDVTRLTVFSSSDSNVADVSALGMVSFNQPGEVAILCRYLEEMVAIRLTYLEPREGFQWVDPPENNYIDHHTFAKLKLLSIPPSEICTDAEFIRRVYLDVCGILPTAHEVRSFLASNEPDRRARLIDALLERPEYSDFWTLKWSDVLRSNRKTIQLKGIHVFQEWLRRHVAENTPLDEVVRELLAASGSTFANPAANYYRIARDPQSLAETTAQLFFGIRMQCAKCHNHPFERWTQDDYYSLAAFFARVKQKKDRVEPGSDAKNPGSEVIYTARAGEVTQPRTGKTMPPKIMGLPIPKLPPDQTRRAVLAAMITARDNPYFARATVNRIWFHLLGKGIVDPVDDFRDSNPPANEELLDALAKDFVEHGFDAKHLIRTILNSRTYQLSAETTDMNRDDSRYFSHAVTRLLTAEQLLDAICTVTEVPEKYAGLPAGTRATQLPDGEVNHPFLKTFGQPARELACECERESDSNLAQALQLINGPTVNEKLRNPQNRVGHLLARKLADSHMLEELYLTTVSRPPTPEEIRVATEHVTRSPDKRKAWEDVLWALLNAKEFLFRH